MRKPGSGASSPPPQSSAGRITTSSPSATPPTPAPSERTTPAPSEPGITGRGEGAMPLRRKTSRRLSAAALSATTTSPGPGSGSGTTSAASTSGAPVSLRTTAFTQAPRAGAGDQPTGGRVRRPSEVGRTGGPEEEVRVHEEALAHPGEGQRARAGAEGLSRPHANAVGDAGGVAGEAAVAEPLAR